MKFGLNYISYCSNYDRCAIAMRSLASLYRTNTYGLERAYLRISYKPGLFDYENGMEGLKSKFDLYCAPDPPEYQGMVMAATASANAMLVEHPDITHIVHLCDDRLFNPEWLQQLYCLINRRPDGIAWSVFRSAYTDFHRIICSEGTDVLMTMHDAIGCTTKEEWQEFFRLYGYTACPDIHHASCRPGQRWATGRDYIQNLGVHFPNDWAIDFVGE